MPLTKSPVAFPILAYMSASVDASLDFVAKDSARALQSLFRSSDGYDEELARVQRGETEDGDDLYD